MTDLQTELLDAERRLQQAQRDGDVAALDLLLDDRLIAIGPDGTRFRKSDDLDAYRSGTSRIDTLVEEDLAINVVGATGATFALCSVSGTFNGGPFAARLRYARTWAYDDKTGWRIVAAQISPA
ncbi:nuclear transport factor 2 family protein [Actinoplanes sp. NEAU-A12]|uniref:Nuclear transport factor 2 family protein n=1 Tax=Actinoplanes sandaracinus TaxID=3045177 RepID=A0ABT6WS06_9ACTN|nr:nuclear transport factor 2 family protein [Actinoplanes sandaracinus]MDI6102410.1 nuclear transport factor 2 family protein [Actinoplanes sandaracinus]